MDTFSSFFYGEITALEIFCLKTFVDYGHKVRLYSYKPLNLPNFIENLDACAIVDQKNLFLRPVEPGKGSVAQFSNIFRYRLLETCNTWWIDTDVICLTDKWPVSKCDIVAGKEDGLINNAILKLEAQVAKTLTDQAMSFKQDVEWGTLGAKLLTKITGDTNFSSCIFDRSFFYPIHYNEWYKPLIVDFYEDVKRACSGSYTLHLWNELGRRARLNKNLMPNPQSFLGELIAKHSCGVFFSKCDPSVFDAHVSECMAFFATLRTS